MIFQKTKYVRCKRAPLIYQKDCQFAPQAKSTHAVLNRHRRPSCSAKLKIEEYPFKGRSDGHKQKEAALSEKAGFRMKA